MVLKVVANLPKDTPIRGIPNEVEPLVGTETACKQAIQEEGILARAARRLIRT